MANKLKPVFNKRIFRDVVFENIDYDAKANFVIERVFEWGETWGIVKEFINRKVREYLK